MKGRLLTVEEISNLKPSPKKYYAEGNGCPLYDGIYILKEDSYFRNDEDYFGNDSSAVKDGKIKVYEWIQQYKYWEILKGIDDGMIKPDAVLISTSKFATGTIDMFQQMPLKNIKAYEPFEIYEEKLYMTFNEARNTAYKNHQPYAKFKHKEMPEAFNIYGVLKWLYGNRNEEIINKMLDEKAWEVEN